MNSHPARFSDLSPAWQAFVRTMQRLDFGCISNTKVENREPFIDEKTTVAKRRKLARNDSPRCETRLKDFDLSAEVCNLIDVLAALKNGRVPWIECRHGLPFELEVNGL